MDGAAFDSFISFDTWEKIVSHRQLTLRGKETHFFNLFIEDALESLGILDF